MIFWRNYYPKNLRQQINTMRFHDITVPLSRKIPIYPGDPPFEIRQWKSLAKGDSANVSYLQLGAHTGTHVDAPAHFIHGAAGVDSMSLDSLIGPAQVIEVPDANEIIDAKCVNENIKDGIERVLFKTRNSSFWSEKESEFQTSFTFLDVEAAKRLGGLGIKLVGIDYLSIEKFKSANHETHLSLLSNNIVILEGLNLANVKPGLYELICLPLKIASGDGDGAPARAVLREI
jgi:arylformamidase